MESSKTLVKKLKPKSNKTTKHSWVERKTLLASSLLVD
jgi:hypothetical protein